ncbi:uncharacterized protein LOC112890529 [Panicum hallii]|uniref:uncharacterized protein LOC112890529 n=1 Tax=Panicum hallii TaxID=206008 RepID=UPI000DF4CCDA|nr:uncharacterized protein LOC112890529 [Panicum hallii]
MNNQSLPCNPTSIPLCPLFLASAHSRSDAPTVAVLPPPRRPQLPQIQIQPLPGSLPSARHPDGCLPLSLDPDPDPDRLLRGSARRARSSFPRRRADLSHGRQRAQLLPAAPSGALPRPLARAVSAHSAERSSPAAACERLMPAPPSGALPLSLAFYQDRSTKWTARANKKAGFRGHGLFTSGIPRSKSWHGVDHSCCSWCVYMPLNLSTGEKSSSWNCELLSIL